MFILRKCFLVFTLLHSDLTGCERRWIDLNSGGSRISHRGGVDPLGGVDPRCGHFSVKMYMKMKELGPVGGGVRPARPRPPRSANAE